MEDLVLLTHAMFEYERGCPARIQHFIKVHSFARWIGAAEGLDIDTQKALEAAALVHDIGIRPALEKYGSSAGPLQQQEGVTPAREMLTALGFSENVIERVCFLVAHHHTYTGVDGMDYQILLEADFLVNAFEDSCTEESIRTALDRFFRTNSGISILKTMFNLA